jgi:hypothetical protein
MAFLEAGELRSAPVGLAGGTTPGADLLRATTIRNVAFAVLGAGVLVLKSGYHGPFESVVNAYAGNLAVSFALYFAVVNATAKYARSRLIAATLTLLAVELFEASDGFGVMGNVYDQVDLVANAAGVGLAIVVDMVTSRALRRRHERPAGEDSVEPNSVKPPSGRKAP